MRAMTGFPMSQEMRRRRAVLLARWKQELSDAEELQMHSQLAALQANDPDNDEIPLTKWRLALANRYASADRLKTVGYNAYLKSDHWLHTRTDAIIRAGGRCERCNVMPINESLQVHHLTYERIGEELPTDLMVLCSTCHMSIHASGIGDQS